MSDNITLRAPRYGHTFGEPRLIYAEQLTAERSTTSKGNITSCDKGLIRKDASDALPKTIARLALGSSRCSTCPIVTPGVVVQVTYWLEDVARVASPLLEASATTANVFNNTWCSTIQY